MSRRKSLPDAAQKGIFTAEDALAGGVTRHQLRLPEMTVPSRGLRINSAFESDARQVLAVYSTITPDTYVSHTSAAQAWGMWLERRHESTCPVHLTRVAGRGAAPRRKGVVGHTAPLTKEDVRSFDALRLTSAEWTWTDLAALGLDVRELVVAGDSLLQRGDGPNRRSGPLGRHPISSVERLSAVLARRGRIPGAVAARKALAMMRPGVDSRPESILRQLIVEAGYPEPLVNRPVSRPGGATILPDLQYRELRIAIQYEGAHHSELVQLGKDINRDFAYESLGWIVVRADKAIFTANGRARFLDRLEHAFEKRRQISGESA
ncbi:hypothetical protein ACQ7DA_07480 [Zafaria sp. J156]|uniref:hypothetical protein n=1 Tax=Zafaria sp. J156 TaxID=3116490 RepID=UPI002E7735CE|nr:hypothetical protein [Zafaria sp. J156]MEE1620786.1 hypothetical protein [Zafaria sp. J156]